MGLTACSAVASVVLCWLQIGYTRELRLAVGIQAQMQQITQRQMVTTALCNELAEYGKKNPAIMPVLQPLMAKPAAAQPQSK